MIIKELIENNKDWNKINKQYYENPRSKIRCSNAPLFSIDPIPSIYWKDVGGLESIKVSKKIILI